MDRAPYASSRILACLLLSVGCGAQPVANSDKTSQAQAVPQPQVASANAVSSGESQKRPAPATAQGVAAEANEQTVHSPATVAEAAQVLDLSTFPLLPGAKEPGARVVASLGYEVLSDVKVAYEFQRRHLLERQWKELSDAQIYDQSASGQFGRDGYHVSVSVFPAGEAGKVAVRLQNHSNINLSKLPVPTGAKAQYAFPGIASFITDAAVEETAAAVRKLLQGSGWQPYGTAGDSMHFKQNAVELNARVLAPPAQPGKTVIDYSALQLSADLPAPPDAESVQYADQLKQLNVEALGTPTDVATFYQTALAPAGWKATTEKPITDRFESFQIFRNPQKDMLTLTLRELNEKKMTRVELKHQSAAEVEEIDRQIKLAAEARKKKEEEERSKPKPKALVTLPVSASDIQATAQEIEFHLDSGKAKSAVETIAKQLQAAGWKGEESVGNNQAGQLSLQKDQQRISITFVDPGFIPAEITISASGNLELERAAAEKQ